MKEDHIESLAQKIAKVISAESNSVDYSSIQKSLDTICERLDRLESSVAVSDFTSQLGPTPHASQDRFAVAEAIVDELFAQNNSKGKACTFEPDKSCDHCSMCNSRGF